MKRFFQLMGLATLICFSFFYTEKVSDVAKEVDELMIQIKENEKRLNPIDATIYENTIIPGIYGKEVDINKSYIKMKRIGEYNSNLLVYDDIKPNISIEKQYDKLVISGNRNIKQVSIIIKVNVQTDINHALYMSKVKNVGLNFFIEPSYFNDNSDIIGDIIKNGHNIGIRADYTRSDFIWMDTVLKKIMKQKNSYCYQEEYNEKYLKICSQNSNYTIKSNIIIDKNITSKIKETITNGSIISIDGNNSTLDELSVAINYILNKGYKIVTLSELLNEKTN